jgi:hypothetical protein
MNKGKAWLYLMRKYRVEIKLEMPCPFTKQGRFVALVPEGIWT